MNPQEFIYYQIYEGALKAEAKERQALNAATTGLEDFRKGGLGGVGKISKLIESKIKEAVKLSKG